MSQVTYALLTRSRLTVNGGASSGINSAFHLHVLGTPPAFVLSQDQTLIKSLSLYSCLSLTDLFCIDGLLNVTLHLVRLVQLSRVRCPLGDNYLSIAPPPSLCQDLLTTFFELFLRN